MVNPNLRLYVDSQCISPYAMSAFVALHEKGLPFDITSVDLGTRENLAPGFASLSLTRRVPTLWHDGFALSESSAIAEYIDQVFPGTALYPGEARDKARARQVQAWLRSDLMPLRQERPTEVLFYGQKYPTLTPAAQAAANKLIAAAETLLPVGAQFLCDQWSIADVDLAVMLNRLALHGDALPERLASYARQQWLRPSLRLWLERERPAL
ncbi:glutathione transferase [Variovorax sp. HJSM1_2]|uniref:glutathione transferase n=1 Tax=Variovorax sp. HJSM1_2 TaxID=3366263 RepID=UPI003BD6FE0B